MEGSLILKLLLAVNDALENLPDLARLVTEHL